MDSEDLIKNTGIFPDTHCFIYKGKKYPIKYDFFKYSSNYFQNHQEEIQMSKEIQLIDTGTEENIELSDETINDFIKFVQCTEIKLTRENIIGLNYLSTRYEISSLKKHTEDYIAKNHQKIAVELLKQHENDKNFDKVPFEDAISSHLEDYIHDDRLFGLKISTLHRILTKYQLKTKTKKLSKEIIEFIFIVLTKYGREASVLFSEVDFGDAKIECVNRLLTEFSSVFDFHFINSSLLLSFYENQSQILRRDEEQRREIEKLRDELNMVKKSQKEENQKIVSEIKNELMNEIKKLRSELNQKNEEQKIKIENQNDLIGGEMKKMKESIEEIKKQRIKDEDKNKSVDKEMKQLKESIEKIKKQMKEKEKQVKTIKEKGIPLLHNERGDFNGIINYLTNKTNGNIHDNKTIEVTASSNRSTVKNILDFNCGSDYTAEGKDDLWICFDFKNRKIKLTQYSIMSHKYGKNQYQLRSWIIEISNDGQTWSKIDEHVNCPTLNGSCITGTFNVQPNDYSRYVRLHQTGTPWGGHNLWFHYIEFYGYLLE